MQKSAGMQYTLFLWLRYVLRHLPLLFSHSLICASSVAARMYFPFGENRTLATGGFSASAVERCGGGGERREKKEGEREVERGRERG